jgi:hypothetical protein
VERGFDVRPDCADCRGPQRADGAFRLSPDIALKFYRSLRSLFPTMVTCPFQRPALSRYDARWKPTRRE